MENEYDSSTIMALIGMMMTKALEEEGRHCPAIEESKDNSQAGTEL